MSEVAILDASAVLAWLAEEPGQEHVEAALDAGPCRISAVNLCEVLGKLCERKMPIEEARMAVEDLGLVVVAFEAEAAALAAALRIRTKPIGASLGDRACLALAEQLRCEKLAPTVYTAESAWARLDWPFRIVVIR
jgi:PIN domain nuclease of toxin-antitoxin system